MKWGWLGVGMILTGCSAVSPESRMSEVASESPETWAGTREGRAGIDTNWVSRLGGGELRGLVDEALVQNPDMRVAAERVNRAVAAAKTAGAQMNPQVKAGLNGNRSKQNFVGLPIGGGGVLSSISNSFGANLSVDWEPDVWGFARAGQAALIAEAEGEGQTYRAARASLAGQVVRAWLALAEANEQIGLARESLGILEGTVEIVEDRFLNALVEDGGTASQVRLAQTQLASGKATLAQWEGERAKAVRQVELLMGRYPAGRLAKMEGLPKVPSKPPAGLPSELLLRRPDVLEAERRFAASGKRLEQGKLAFYPSITLTTQGGTSSGSLRDLLDSNFGVWSLVGGLSQPIWAGGALRSEYARLSSEDRQALASLQKTVLNAFGEVEQALVADDFLARREAAVRKAVETSREAQESAFADYAGGTGDVLTLLNAQSQRIQLAQQRVTLRRLHLDNRVSLHLALGGDYRVGK